jgi:hypothetical protein
VNPGAAHPFHQDAGIVGFKAEGRCEKHRIIQVAFVRPEAQFVSFAHLHVALKIQNFDPAHELPDIAATITGIASQSASYGPLDAYERFQAAQSMADGFGNESRHGRSGAGDDFLAMNLDGSKSRMAEPQNHSLDAFIPNEQIAAAAQNANGQPLGKTPFDDGRQLIARTRLDKILSGSADSQVRERRQRNVRLNNFAKGFEGRHEVPFRFTNG